MLLTGLEGLAGNGIIRLKWNAIAGATSYNVKISNTTNNYVNTPGTVTVTATIISVGNVTEYDVTSANSLCSVFEMENEVPYFITVQTTNTVGVSYDAFEIVRYPSAVIDYTTFRTNDLTGYLPIDNIIGNLPFELPSVETGIPQLLDFDYQLETNEMTITQKDMLRTSNTYDDLDVTGYFVIKSIIDENGIIYNSGSDYNVVGSLIYWSGDHIPTQDQTYTVSYTTSAVETLIKRNPATYEYDSLTNTNVTDIVEVRDAIGTIYNYLEHYYLFRNRIYWLTATLTIPQNVDSTVLTDGSLPAGNYYYVVTAYRVTNSVTVTIGETTKSAEVPVSLTGVRNGVNLTWDNVDFADGYRIYRSTATGNYTNKLIKDISIGNVNTFTDLGLPTITGTPATINAAYIRPAIGREYDVTYNYSGTTTTYSSNKCTGITGSASQQIRNISLLSTYDTDYYLKLYDNPALSVIKLDVFTVCPTASTTVYASANIENYTGYYSMFTGNLLIDTDPSFESITVTLANNWVGVNNATLTINSTQHKFGSYSLKQTLTASGSGYAETTNDITVVGSSYYTLSAYVLATPTYTVTIGLALAEYDVDNTFVVATSITVVPSDANWNRVVKTIQTGLTTTSVKVRLNLLGSTSDACYWDAVQLEDNEYVTQYTNTFINNNTMLASLVETVSPTTTIGTVEIKFIPVSPTIVNFYSYTPAPVTLINFEPGNFVKSFEIDFTDNSEGVDRLVKYRTRVFGDGFETNWGDAGTLDIPQNRHLESTERMFTNLPDVHIYNKDILKVPVTLRTGYNVYGVIDTYGNEFGYLYYETQRAKDDFFMRFSRDVDFDSTFGSLFDSVKTINFQFADYRNIIENTSVAATEGSTLAAIKLLCNVFTGADPVISLIRDYDWWILNGNMLQNPSFEIVAGYAGAVPFWTPNANATNVINYTQFKYGSASLKVTSSIAGTNNIETISDFMPIDPTYNYTLSANYLVTVTASLPNSVFLKTYYYDNAGTLLSSTISASATLGLQDSWNSISATFPYSTFPAGYLFTITPSATITAGTLYTNNGYTFTVINPVTASYLMYCSVTAGAETSSSVTTTLTFVSGSPTGNLLTTFNIKNQTEKAKVSLGVNTTGINKIIYWDGAQFEQGDGTPYEDFAYYLEDAVYPEIIPPTLWDKNEMAFAFVLQVRNPYGFDLDESYITETIKKFLPAHVKIYISYLTVQDSMSSMVWDIDSWDTRSWY